MKNSIDMILENLKKFAGIDFFYEEFLNEIKEALQTNETYVKKFNIYQDFTIHELHLMLRKIINEDDPVIDNVPLMNIIYHEKENRSVALLPGYIIVTNQNIEDIQKYGYKLREKIINNIKKTFGKIVVGYFSFSNGEVFLTSHKNSSPDDILKNVSNVSWNEVLLNKLEINAFMKTNGEDSVIVIPPEEGSRYRLLRMVLRFNLNINKIESFLRGSAFIGIR